MIRKEADCPEVMPEASARKHKQGISEGSSLSSNFANLVLKRCRLFEVAWSTLWHVLTRAGNQTTQFAHLCVPAVWPRYHATAGAAPQAAVPGANYPAGGESRPTGSKVTGPLPQFHWPGSRCGSEDRCPLVSVGSQSLEMSKVRARVWQPLSSIPVSAFCYDTAFDQLHARHAANLRNPQIFTLRRVRSTPFTPYSTLM